MARALPRRMATATAATPLRGVPSPRSCALGKLTERGIQGAIAGRSEQAFIGRRFSNQVSQSVVTVASVPLPHVPPSSCRSATHHHDAPRPLPHHIRRDSPDPPPRRARADHARLATRGAGRSSVPADVPWRTQGMQVSGTVAKRSIRPDVP